MFNEEGFRQFWASYPRRVGKLAAEKVWNRLKPGNDVVQQMLGAIGWQRATREWREGFIPHPKTWLTQGRWMDEPEVELVRRTVLECPHIPPCPAPGRTACRTKSDIEAYKASRKAQVSS